MTSPTDALLGTLLDIRGVEGAAMLSDTGEVLNAVGHRPPDPGVVTAARAVLQSLQAATDAPFWNDLLLDLESGPLLLTPVGERVMLVQFEDVAALGRVRLGVKKILAA